MASVINTNVASLNAQRNLNSSQTALATSLQRLSSGLRINSAKDDAAGLAISDRFTTQIRGLNQASRNANDAISLSQTAEGALGEVTSNLQRIRELAVQSANATNSSSDRAALDLEVQQRLSEIDRISSQTSFNGQKILDGTFGQAAFQVGANVGETITLDLSTSMRPNQIGQLAEVTSTTNLNNIATDTAIAGSTVTAAVTNFDFSTTQAASTSVAVGAFTGIAESDGAAGTIDYSFTVSDGGVNSVTSGPITLDDAGLTAGALATALSSSANANFATDGGTVAGFTINYNNVGGGGTLTDAIAGGTLTFSRADGAAFTVDDNVDATNSGTASGGTGAASSSFAGIAGTPISVSLVAADTTANKIITVDSGSDITLDGVNEAANIVLLQAALDAQSVDTYIVSGDGAGKLTIATVATGAGNPAPEIGGTNAVTFIDGTEVLTAGVVSATLNIAAGDFSIQLGDSTPVSVSGQFTSAQSIVDAVNRALAGNATAQLNDDGTMSIFSDEDVVITGTDGLNTLGLDALTEADGNLIGSNILDVASSNDIIRRLDSALTSISDLRSTFGAIQNRFESTISNLGTAVENLSAARSRIMDADFAAETAALTRAQILQQAGTAMLSQANAIPQNVLSLLQG